MNIARGVLARLKPPTGRDAVKHCGSCGQPLGHWATDKLTGLLDRWGWDEQAPRVWAGACQQNAALALLLLDIDHFKRINDTVGHPAGDTVLQAVAVVLRDAARGRDLVGRYGGHVGDEFLVLLPETELADAVVVAHRISHGINSAVIPVKSAANTTTTIAKVTVSIGIAAGYPGHDVAVLGDLLLNADAALRDAKSHGRNQIRTGGTVDG